jgi:hypothetical protein
VKQTDEELNRPVVIDRAARCSGYFVASGIRLPDSAVCRYLTEIAFPAR